MSRSYRNVRIKKHRVYSVEDLMSQYAVSANTVSNWVGEGLVPSDLKRPYCFRGAVVDAFHKQRRAVQRRQLRAGQFKCTGCKAAVFPAIETVKDYRSETGKFMYEALCHDCGATLFKVPSETDCDIIEDCRNPNTSRTCLHEENGLKPGGIGISEQKDPQELHLANDRVIYNWQTYAERYDTKTIDGHLSAIRYFERLTEGKPFKGLKIGDVSKVRNELKRRVRAEAGDDQLATSTIKHRASHIVDFLTWLLKQAEFSSLPKDLADHCALPKAAFSSPLPMQARAYPTLLEAEEMLARMPSGTALQRRARAIVALAYLGCLRADTLASLRIGQVDIAKRRITQDGTALRSKNGKSEYIFWFPISKCFENEVIAWMKSLTEMGFGDDDALFPSAQWLSDPARVRKAGRPPIPVPSTKQAIDVAFALASANSEIKYTPHSAKDTIGAARDERPLTRKQRKAWSQNMGHEDERTTERHYGKLSADERADLLESIGENDGNLIIEFSDEKKIAMFDKFLSEIHR